MEAGEGRDLRGIQCQRATLAFVRLEICALKQINPDDPQCGHGI